MKDESVPLRTILQNFINHVENLEARLKEKDDLYETEFQELKNISDSLKSQEYYACSEGEKSVNRRKNRYKDILPFDVSRVVLSEFPGVAGSDYINANYIRGASGSPAYIASQGPLPHTVADFWRMTVECEVQVIVMACNQTEAGKHKCEHYVPDQEDDEQLFGDVSVMLSQSRQVCPDFTVKKLTVRYTGTAGNREERLVCQFHYSAWPDHGVPSSVVPLLRMIRMLRDTQASETLPVLVHCSAGCGRTGTICAIDYVWGLLKAGKLTPAFSLFDLVAEMRRQRIAMVQTKDQYMLVHRAVRRLFADQLRVIESHPYANVDSVGKVLSASVDSGDYEEICLANEAKPSAKDCPAPSPPPRHRKSAPRHHCYPPPLPHKRKASQPAQEVASVSDRPSSELEYQGSLDRAESGRRAGVGRLRLLFEEATEDETAAPRPRLARSKSSAALRHRSPGRLVGRPLTGSVGVPRNYQLVRHVPLSESPTVLSAETPKRHRSPSQTRRHDPTSDWSVQTQMAPSIVSTPVQVNAPGAGAKSPPQQELPPVRQRTSPPAGVTVNSVATAPPVVHVVNQTCSPSSRAFEKLCSHYDRRPTLPIKRSKSLKMPTPPLRVQRLGPAYLALENRPSLGPALKAQGAAASRSRSPPTGSTSPAAVQRPSTRLDTSPDGSPPRHGNIELLRRYEEELVERSRQLGLNDTLPEPETNLSGPMLGTNPVFSADDDGIGLTSIRPHESNALPPSPLPPAGQQSGLITKYPNCTPQVNQNLRRIESDLQHNPRSGFYDASGELAARPRLPAATTLGWHARERRNSFRQAMEGWVQNGTSNYETIWVGERQHPPSSATPGHQQQRLESTSAPPQMKHNADASPSPPFVPARSAAVDPSRPSAAPIARFTAQGTSDRSSASLPLLVGNSLFWPEALNWHEETDTAVVTQPFKKTTNQETAYCDTPSPPCRSTSLSVSENSAFKPYLATPSLESTTICKRSEVLSRTSFSERFHGSRGSLALPSSNSSDQRPVAPPRRRIGSAAASQPQRIESRHLSLADAELLGEGPDQGGSVDGLDSDSEPAPPAVPEKTQAAYEVPTPIRDVVQPGQHRQGEQPPLKSIGGGGGDTDPAQPCDRAGSTEARPPNRALGRLQTTASSVRSRLGGRTEQWTPPRDRPSPTQVNAHSRRAYI